MMETINTYACREAPRWLCNRRPYRNLLTPLSDNDIEEPRNGRRSPGRYGALIDHDLTKIDLKTWRNI